MPEKVTLGVQTRHTVTFKTARGELKQPPAVSSLFREEKCEAGELLSVQSRVEIRFYISEMTRILNEPHQTAPVVHKTLQEAEIPSGFLLRTS